MDSYTLESFITYCDEMQISNESFSSIKSTIITGFSRLILWIESKVKTMKDNRVRNVLLKLLNRAKMGLAKSKSLNENNPEMVKQLQTELNNIKEESIKINSEVDDTAAPDRNREKYAKEFESKNPFSQVGFSKCGQINGRTGTYYSIYLKTESGTKRTDIRIPDDKKSSEREIREYCYTLMKNKYIKKREQEDTK